MQPHSHLTVKPFRDQHESYTIISPLDRAMGNLDWIFCVTDCPDGMTSGVKLANHWPVNFYNIVRRGSLIYIRKCELLFVVVMLAFIAHKPLILAG